MATHNYHAKVIRLGIPDQVIEHGTQTELYAMCKYDAASIYEQALHLVQSPVCAYAQYAFSLNCIHRFDRSYYSCTQ